MRIDLNGPQGNAFYLIGLASKLGKQLDYTPAEIKDIQGRMMSGDYQHLVSIFIEEFGAVVELDYPAF
jgi:hypothetical protein